MDILKSKKFQAALVALVVSIIVSLVPSLEGMEEHLGSIIAAFVAYIIGQGLADFGKEAHR